MMRSWLRAGVVLAAVTAAVAVALALGQRRPVRAPAGVGAAPVRPRIAPEPAGLDFYDVGTRSTVTVPLSRVRKRRTVRGREDGRRQERYAAMAEVEREGRTVRLFKFISREQYEALDVPEEEA